MTLSTSRPKIAFISQPEYFRFIYENELDDIADVMELKYNYSMPPEAFSGLVDFDADINFFFRGEFVPDVVLKQLRGKKVNLSSEPFPRMIDGRTVYTIDSLDRYLAFRRIQSKPFDYVFHYDAASLPFLEWDGLKLSGEFAFPVATSVYKPDDVSKVWDVFFIGRSTRWREIFFGKLKHYHHFLHISHGVWGPGLVDYMNKSRICLNVHAENEVSWEPRLQMMLSCGAFVISEKITPNKYFRPGVDYVEVTWADEMFNTAEYFLKHEEERNQIAQNGYNRVRELLDSKKVFSDFIQKLDRNEYPVFSGASRNHYLSQYSKFLKLMKRIRGH
jgi:spore maturation protein CgeB